MANKNNVALSARGIALGTIAPKAMAEGIARADVARAIKAAWSKTNEQPVKVEFMAGRIAAYLRANDKSKGNMNDILLIAHARNVITKMAGATGTGKLKKGQTRRTPIEEAAYGAARVATTAILKLAGVKTFKAQGGDRSKTGNGTKKGQGKAKAPPVPSNDVSPAKAAPKMKAANDVNDYVTRQAAVLDAFQRKNAALMSSDLANAVAAFYAAVRDATKPRD